MGRVCDSMFGVFGGFWRKVMRIFAKYDPVLRFCAGVCRPGQRVGRGGMRTGRPGGATLCLLGCVSGGRFAQGLIKIRNQVIRIFDPD